MNANKILLILFTISGTFCKVPDKAPKAKHDNNTKIIVFGYTCLGITLTIWKLGYYFAKQEEARIKELASKKPLKISPINENIDNLPIVMRVQKNITKNYRRMVRRDSEQNFNEVDSILNSPVNSPVSPLSSQKNNTKIDDLLKESENLHNKIDSLVTNPDTPELLEMRSVSLESENTNRFGYNEQSGIFKETGKGYNNLGFDVNGKQIKKMKHTNINDFLKKNTSLKSKKSPTSPSLSKSRTSVTGIGLNLSSNNTNDDLVAKVEDNTNETPSVEGYYVAKKRIKINNNLKIKKLSFLQIKKHVKRPNTYVVYQLDSKNNNKTTIELANVTYEDVNHLISNNSLEKSRKI